MDDISYAFGKYHQPCTGGLPVIPSELINRPSSNAQQMSHPYTCTSETQRTCLISDDIGLMQVNMQYDLTQSSHWLSTKSLAWTSPASRSRLPNRTLPSA